ncbi:MAG: hypothetical protein R2719_01765 [Micropruina sp.]
MTERLAVLLSGEVSGYLDRHINRHRAGVRYADNYLRAGQVAIDPAPLGGGCTSG